MADAPEAEAEPVGEEPPKQNPAPPPQPPEMGRAPEQSAPEQEGSKNKVNTTVAGKYPDSKSPCRKPCQVTRLYERSPFPTPKTPCGRPCPQSTPPPPSENAQNPCCQPMPEIKPCWPPTCATKTAKAQSGGPKLPPGKIPEEDADDPPKAAADPTPAPPPKEEDTPPGQEAAPASTAGESEPSVSTDSKQAKGPARSKIAARGSTTKSPTSPQPLRVDETLKSLSCMCPLIDPPRSIPCLVACSPESKNCPLHDYPQKEPMCMRPDLPAHVSCSMADPIIPRRHECGSCGPDGTGCKVHSYCSKRFFPGIDAADSCTLIESTKSTSCLVPLSTSNKMLMVGETIPGHMTIPFRCRPCSELPSARECTLAQGIATNECICGMHCSPPVPACTRHDIIRKCGVAPSDTPSPCRVHNPICPNPNPTAVTKCKIHPHCCKRH